MPAIPDIPRVFYIAVRLYRGPSQEGRIDYEAGLYIEETWLDGATLKGAVSLVDDGDLIRVYQIEPNAGRVVNASSQVANDWFMRNGAEWPAAKPWPQFVADYCEFPLPRQEPREKYYSSAEDPPH